MRRLAVFGVGMALVVAWALPAAADAPEMSVFTYEQTWVFDNPCTAAQDDTVITSDTTIREILRDGERRITAVKMRVTGTGDWTGHGTDTGVELYPGETVSHRLVLTNTETSQKFKVTIRGHYNPNTGEWNTGYGPAWDLRCISG